MHNKYQHGDDFMCYCCTQWIGPQEAKGEVWETPCDEPSGAAAALSRPQQGARAGNEEEAPHLRGNAAGTDQGDTGGCHGSLTRWEKYFN